MPKIRERLHVGFFLWLIHWVSFAFALAGLFVFILSMWLRPSIDYYLEGLTVFISGMLLALVSETTAFCMGIPTLFKVPKKRK